MKNCRCFNVNKIKKEYEMKKGVDVYILVGGKNININIKLFVKTKKNVIMKINIFFFAVELESSNLMVIGR